VKFATLAAIFGVVSVCWLAIFVSTAKRPMTWGVGLRRLETVLCWVAVILFVILITEYEQGRDLFGMGCAIPCMAGMLIMGLIAAVGSLGNPFKGSPPHDGGAGT
jgi:hypothetical protein